jgi:hypothetical protein
MVAWSAVFALVVSALLLGPFSETAPGWAGDAALLMMAVSVFILVCLFESGLPKDSSNSSAS